LVPVTRTDPTSAAPHALDDAELLRLYPRLRRFAAVVGPAEVEPDDLVQDALERLFARGADDVEHVEAYVRQIIVRAASNHRRRLGRGRRALDRFSRRDAQAVATNDSYPSDTDFLDALAPTARAVLYLREVEGLDVRNVATELAMSEASVKQIARRARLAL
jgi:RNA polymerase sigma factor (sigma-70 family)